MYDEREEETRTRPTPATVGVGQPPVVLISNVMSMGVATPTKQVSFDFKLVTATGID